MVEFEHTLFQLLLLVGLLNSKPPQYKYTPFIIGTGLLLAFLPPIIPIPIPWDLILSISIPLLLWQNALRIINSRWRGKWKELFLWLGTTLLFWALLTFTNTLEIPGAILFGLITASMIWRSGETVSASSFISQIGPMTLVFLLTEIEPLVETPTRYIGGIFSGASFGILFALIAVSINQKSGPRLRNWIAIGQIYAAYGFATFLGVSAVAASLASVIVYVVLGMYRGIWPDKNVKPAPFNSWAGFGLSLVLFLFLGWQAHHPISAFLLLEVLLGCGIGMLIAWIGLYLKLPSFDQRGSIWRAGLRTALILFPALLIWPRGIINESTFLAYAFGIASVVLAISRLMLYSFFEE
ncbi:MAG: hypothetical protein PVG14_08720 [Anaerolineales bacterium]|jgi:hypothetical protein